MFNDVAETVGAAIANKIIDKKQNKFGVSVYGRLFKMVKHIMDDPEGAELNLKVVDKEIYAAVYPEGNKKKGFTVKVFVFGDEDDLNG